MRPIADLKLAVDDDGEPEIFRSLQGEGPMAGRVRAFIRLSGCNLHCRWCDTPYTWNWQGTPYPHEDDRKFDIRQEVAKLAADEAAGRVLALNTPGVVVTGGEPMMQPHGLRQLLAALRSFRPALSLEIETNGSFTPDAELLEHVDLFVVSPKLAHSGNDPKVTRAAVVNFAHVPTACFKFVVRTINDLDEVERLMNDHGVPLEKVWVMPEGRTSEELDRRLNALTTAVLKRGFSLTDRAHIRLFGDTRGT